MKLMTILGLNCLVKRASKGFSKFRTVCSLYGTYENLSLKMSSETTGHQVPKDLVTGEFPMTFKLDTRV